MWYEEIEGTAKDDAYRAELVAELKDRSHRILQSTKVTIPVNYGSGVLRRTTVGPVDIKCEHQRGIWIDVFVEGDGDRRAYTENGGEGVFINRRLVTEVVLPTLRRAMILDDIVNEGGDGERG